ncbi:hypothetical protein HNQ56_000977 [Anaerotaenia torta]|uniref:hypothetical protein n=1 Tax=Anaerotaenia torta TaxID=433293 RepID=UPI003D1C4C0F
MKKCLTEPAEVSILASNIGSRQMTDRIAVFRLQEQAMCFCNIEKALIRKSRNETD